MLSGIALHIDHRPSTLLCHEVCILQAAASFLEQLQSTADKDRKEWEAFAQTMYDEVGKARAEKNVLQRYSAVFLPQLACRYMFEHVHTLSFYTAASVCCSRLWHVAYSPETHICNLFTTKTSLP